MAAEDQEDNWVDVATDDSEPDPPSLSNRTDSHNIQQYTMLPFTLIDNLPDLEELEQQQNLQNVMNLIPPPPPPRGLARMEHINRLTSSSPPLASLSTPSVMVSSLTLIDNNNNDEEIAQVENGAPETIELHSDLMAAIRSAGGVENAGLRPIAHTPTVNSDQNKRTTKKATGCLKEVLMKELHNKLNLRRQGISGSGCNNSPKTDRSDNGYTLGGHCDPLISHLSSFIPEHTLSAMQIRSNDNENDENEDDWAD